MSQAPPRIYIDPRVAFRLPQSKADASEPQAGGSGEPVGYIREDIYDAQLREAAGVDQEIIIQIQLGSKLYGLSNLGRLFAYAEPLGIQQQLDDVPEGMVGWYLIADRELKT